MMTAEQLETHRVALVGHCHRMLGSAVEADDAVQETLVQAWRAQKEFDGRASLRNWLYRIATNVCLDAPSDRGRRERPVAVGLAGTVHDDLVERPRTHWLEPIPDCAGASGRACRDAGGHPARLRGGPPAPAAPAACRPAPRGSAELAGGRDCGGPRDLGGGGEQARFQRARATLGRSAPPERSMGTLTPGQETLLARYLSVLKATISTRSPPCSVGTRPFPCLPTRSGSAGRPPSRPGSRTAAALAGVHASFPPPQTALGQYRPEGAGRSHRPWALAVLELSNDGIAAMNHFLDTARLFPRFGLPPELA